MCFSEKDFDDIYEDGVFAMPRNNDEPRIKVRAIYNYCKKKGINPESLSSKEIELFLEKDTKK